MKWLRAVTVCLYVLGMDPPLAVVGTANAWVHHCRVRKRCSVSRQKSPKIAITLQEAKTPLTVRDFNDIFERPDYLITDSLDLYNRPSLFPFLMKPRNLLGLSLVGAGTGLTVCNVFGSYNDVYVLLQEISIFLAVLNASMDYQATTLLPSSSSSSQGGWDARSWSDPRYCVSPNIRCGCIDDAVVHWYSATYTAAAAWLALRTSVACPTGLTAYDPLLGAGAVLIFVFSITAPVLTLMHHYQVWDLNSLLTSMVSVARRRDVSNCDSPSSETPNLLPPLSDLELFRARSLLGIGIFGCIFAPEAITLTAQGQDWWLRVLDIYPGQPWIESTNALFGVYATQASMLAHRAGKEGIAPYSILVPTFVAVCALLTVVPSAFSLFWWGDEISFFDFYTR